MRSGLGGTEWGPGSSQLPVTRAGVQVGMSGVCYPDSLIGTIPNLYYYAANNPSEVCWARAA